MLCKSYGVSNFMKPSNGVMERLIDRFKKCNKYPLSNNFRYAFVVKFTKSGSGYLEILNIVLISFKSC